MNRIQGMTPEEGGIATIVFVFMWAGSKGEKLYPHSMHCCYQELNIEMGDGGGGCGHYSLM